MINRKVRMATSAAIAAAVLALTIAVRPLEAQQQAPVKVPTSVLEGYVGEWVYPDGNSVMVRLDGGTLFREIPGQRVPFVPLSETLFRLGPVFTAEFVIDRAGGITQILSDGTGVEFRLRRKGSPPAQVTASPAPAAVSVPRSVLERYVGVYEYIPGQMRRTDLRIVISLRGDKLVREMGAEDILTPISETRFRVGGTSLMVEFVVDEAGVTQVLGSGGQQMLARLTRKR
jgi:hypothetical protein